MADGKALTQEQIVEAGVFLWRQIVDAKTIGEALRLLLIERGLFSDAEYQKTYKRAYELLQDDVSKKLTEAGELQLLELLRNHKGPAN